MCHWMNRRNEERLPDEVEDQGPNPEQLYAQQEQQRILSEAMNQLTPGMRKQSARELDERSTEETARINGNFRQCGKSSSVHGRKKFCARD